MVQSKLYKRPYDAVRITIVHKVKFVHHVMSNLVSRIRVIPQIGRDETHEFFIFRVCLVRWVRIIILDQLLVTFKGVTSQAFLELSEPFGSIPTPWGCFADYLEPVHGLD